MDILDPLEQNAYTATCNSQHQYRDQHHHRHPQEQLLEQQQEQEQQYRELMNIASFQEKPLQSTEALTAEYLDEAARSVDSSAPQQQQQHCNLEALSSFSNEDDTNLNSTIQDEANDDDSFVALCTDASSVLNNDPSRRYYVNKLYQPINGQSEDTQLIEHDDEYLLYQELRFLESTAQELTDGRQRVQLSKILEDDEGEDDDGVDPDQLDDSNCRREDRLDQLHLTTIIEGFESFPSSPLIDSCHGRDPLISEACNSRLNEQLQDKPDSTCQGVISPSSSNSSTCEAAGGVTSNTYNTTSIDHFQHHHHHHQQFDTDDQDDHLQLALSGHKEDDEQHSHFLSLNSGNTMNHESQQNHHSSHQQHQHHQQLQHLHHNHHNSIQIGDEQYGDEQINQDSTSEISCFQQVSSTLESIEESNKLCTDLPSSIFNNNQNQDHQHLLHQESLEVKPNNGNITTGKPRKRSRRQVDSRADDSLVTGDELRSKVKGAKSRVKRKKTAQDGENRSLGSKERTSSSPIISNMTSTIVNNNPEQNSESNQTMSSVFNSSKTDNEYQQEHITTDDDHFLNDDLDGLSMMDDEDDSQSGSRSHPHMNKYRRRTANARERIRMREINQAFEKLKKVVPVELIQQSTSGDESDQTSVSSRRGSGGAKSGTTATKQGAGSNPQPIKLTKITTLRLAVSYIAKLSEVLSQHPEGNSSSVLHLSAATSESTGGESEASRTGGLAKGKSSEASGSANKVTRKKRARSSSNRKLVDDIKTRSPAKGTDDLAKRNSNQDFSIQKVSVDNNNKVVSSNVCVTNQHDNQQRLSQPMIIANNVLQGNLQQMSNNFVHVQQQQPQQQQQQQQLQQKQQQFAFSQQPLTISQGSNNGQERTFVTPVAVAILGIPTGNNQTSTEPQTLQLLGIQNAQQLQQQRPQQQHFQVASPYNLVAHQPQQVTLTLDDVNGLSVLRLTNPQTGSSQQRTIQLQQGQRIVQQSQVLTASQGYNYATYQPLQVQSNNLSSVGVRPAMFHQAAIQFCNTGDLQNATALQTKEGGIITTTANQQTTTQSISDSRDSHSGATISLTSTPTTTGTNSDYRTIGLPPNAIVQHLSSNSNSNSLVQSTHFKIQQSNCSGGQILTTNQLVAVSPGGTQLTTNRASNICGGPAQKQANLIYINHPPTGISTTAMTMSNGNRSINHHEGSSQQTPSPQQSAQQVEFQRIERNSNQSTTNELKSSQHENQLSTGGSFEQMKFIAQFNTQSTNRQQQDQALNNEANIRQLVASIATSIHPNGEKSGKTNLDESNDARRQPKRTYRFHNYDGNMITNHLYNNNQDKQIQQQQHRQQQHVAKRPELQTEQTINQVSCQRSRQNSLSSTCSTTSSSSSSVASMSTASPNLPLVPILIKSPSPEKSLRTNTGQIIELEVAPERRS